MTATITDPEAGWADPPGEGWKPVGTTATFEVTFADNNCVVAIQPPAPSEALTPEGTEAAAEVVESTTTTSPPTATGAVRGVTPEGTEAAAEVVESTTTTSLPTAPASSSEAPSGRRDDPRSDRGGVGRGGRRLVDDDLVDDDLVDDDHGGRRGD